MYRPNREHPLDYVMIGAMFSLQDRSSFTFSLVQIREIVHVDGNDDDDDDDDAGVPRIVCSRDWDARHTISTAKERRASRKPRRIRKGPGRVISGTEYETLLKHI